MVEVDVIMSEMLEEHYEPWSGDGECSMLLLVVRRSGQGAVLGQL